MAKHNNILYYNWINFISTKIKRFCQKDFIIIEKNIWQWVKLSLYKEKLTNIIIVMYKNINV